MQNDLSKLILFIWMGLTIYFMYYIYSDIKYIASLMHAYMSMIMSHIGK